MPILELSCLSHYTIPTLLLGSPVSEGIESQADQDLTCTVCLSGIPLYTEIWGAVGRPLPPPPLLLLLQPLLLLVPLVFVVTLARLDVWGTGSSFSMAYGVAQSGCSGSRKAGRCCGGLRAPPPPGRALPGPPLSPPPRLSAAHPAGCPAVARGGGAWGRLPCISIPERVTCPLQPILTLERRRLN